MKALLWDVDGTIAETERDGHRVAFNRAFEIHGLPWQWDEAYYGELLAVTGGRERLLLDMNQRGDAPASPGDREKLAGTLHLLKNEIYAQRVRDGKVRWRAGVRALMEQCRSLDLPMGIATTSSRVNVDVLLRAELGPGWTQWFQVVVCGEDVRRKKPDPEAYRLAVEALAIAPRDAVAIEDSPQGAAAARAAGTAVIVTRSVYFPDAGVAGALAVGPGLHSRDGWKPLPLPVATGNAAIGLAEIEAWYSAS